MYNLLYRGKVYTVKSAPMYVRQVQLKLLYTLNITSRLSSGLNSVSVIMCIQ